MYRLNSINTVSIVYSLFQLARQGSLEGSTLPFLGSRQGRLTLDKNCRTGGLSG